MNTGPSIDWIKQSSFICWLLATSPIYDLQLIDSDLKLPIIKDWL